MKDEIETQEKAKRFAELHVLHYDRALSDACNGHCSDFLERFGIGECFDNVEGLFYTDEDAEAGNCDESEVGEMKDLLEWQWFAVSHYFYDFLRDHNYVTFSDGCGGYWWCRETIGQAVYLDGCIYEAAGLSD